MFSSSEKWKRPLLQSVIFFVVYYLYALLVIEPRLVYYTFGRTNFYHPFLTGWNFLFEKSAVIGGPIAYLTGFLSQCFYFSWAGALIVTIIAGLFHLLVTGICTLTKARHWSWTGYLIPALLLVLYTDYDHQLLDILSLLAVLAAFVLYLRANSGKIIFAAGLFLAEFAFVYYVAGGIAILFGLLAAFYELLIRGRKWLAGGVLLWVAACCAVMYLLDIPVSISHLKIIHKGFVSGRLQYSIYIMNALPIFILAGIASGNYFFKAGYRKTRPDKHNPEKKSQFRFYAGLIFETTAPLVLIPLAFCIAHKKADKVFLQSAFYCDKGDWQNVLECAADCPDNMNNILCNHDINRALYYTDRLGEKMFSYRQVPQALLMPDASPSPILPRYSRMTDTFLELGYLGEAERLACEVLELTNGCPYIIKRLVLINLVKKQNETAEIYLKALSKDLVYGHFARQVLRRLDEDPELSDYEPVRYFRSIAVDTDNAGNFSVDDFFLRPLQKNPQNKMAFEYMMAFYLLTGQTGKVAENIHRMKNLPYEKMPGHYGEALIIYVVSGGNSVDLSAFPPDSETMQRFNRFDEEAGELYNKTHDIKAMEHAMAETYGDSYMFYLNFTLPRARR